MWEHEERNVLLQARKNNPDPRIRHRAQALLLVADGHTESEVAQLFQTARHRLRAWKKQFLTKGINGLADAHRTGRPPKLTAANLAYLEEALGKSPQDYGFMGTTWTVLDLHELMVQKQAVKVSKDTIHRAILKLGYRYRRPKHDLKHRQDPEAVDSAREVLEWLKKTAPEVMEGFNSSSLMNVKFMPTPNWLKSGKRKVAL
jgi:transposase